jgi:CheY-like chemotaxis protein
MMISHKDSMHILLADDDEDDRTFFQWGNDRTKINNKLTLFNDGQDLMDYLSDPELMPHILFYLNMPYMSGLNV